ncbi:conserved hypothetical protein [Anaeromyxobacter sp. K]|uniref:hypothetical protein n=1 Tax=Anaeromyxobacter sp. (strain K) TaxID=447217 RepID=UPI00015F86C9|nr:hypothetical protein [Anaeromyxobacter sp. K]ACG71607.1 conserved hypothetical protein [Anaeromyxobacter sp. K]
MSASGLWLDGVALAALLLSLARDRRRTAAAVRAALVQLVRILPSVAALILLVGLALAVVPQAAIARAIGPGSGVGGVAAALAIGSAAMLPSFVAFPLAGALREAGAGYPQIAAFVGTVMSVGVVTLPLEARVLGWRAAALRNALALVTAMLFALAAVEVLG